MKRFVTFISFILICVAVVAERSGMAWPLEQPVMHYLATITHRPLPLVTAVVLPLRDGVLVPEDVALTLRATLSFRPRLILVAEPLGDLSRGPLSLIKEAQETGLVQGVPLFFATWDPCSVFLIPQTLLPKATAGVAPAEDRISELMPLLARADDGTIVSSLWWRGLFFSEKKQLSGQDAPDSMTFLLGGRCLVHPKSKVLWLEPQAGLPLAEKEHAGVVSLDDFLLRREEMERGQIRPDLDLLFRDRTVLIGGPAAAVQANRLQGAEQQLATRPLGTTLYGVLLLFLSLGVIVAAGYSGIDFALVMFFSIFLYAGAVFFLFRSTGIFLPLLQPGAMLIVALLKKL